MDTFAPVQTSWFKDPNVFTCIVTGWDDQTLGLFEFRAFLFSKVLAGLVLINLILAMFLQKFENLLELFELIIEWGWINFTIKRVYLNAKC